jgi:hypothetical protein
MGGLPCCAVGRTEASGAIEFRTAEGRISHLRLDALEAAYLSETAEAMALNAEEERQ